MPVLYQENGLIIRYMNKADFGSLCKAEDTQEIEYLRNHLENQRRDECACLLAVLNGEIAGYVFLYSRCCWGGLKDRGIPGIVDLFVYEPYRRMGIAGKLMDVAEALAARIHDKVYLDVCLTAEYGPAQRFYIMRGYLPDGNGVYYEQEICPKDKVIKNDDELTLCLVKNLKREG